MISSSSPLTRNVSSSQESFHLPQLLAQLCASLWLALHVPMPPSIASHSSTCVPTLRGPPWSQLCSTRQHTKREAEELKSIISLSGCSLLPIIRHSTLYEAMPQENAWTTFIEVLSTGLNGETFTSRQQGEEGRSMSWDGRLRDFPKNWWALETHSLDESPGTDKFSTPRVSQIRTRPPAHTNITQTRDKGAMAAAADVHVHLMKEGTLQQNFWTLTWKLLLTSTTLQAWIKGVPINIVCELYFPHLIPLIRRKKQLGTVSLCLSPSHTGFFPISNLLLILTLNLNDL